ncbi:MAG: hypothetical protein OCC45_11025 [Desulfotalea sp.]
MDASKSKRFDVLYTRRLKLLKHQGKSIMDCYSEAVKKIKDHF